MQRHAAVLRGIRRTGEKVGAEAVVLKLGIRQKALHVAREQLDADHAVDCPVRIDERLRVGDDRAAVSGERVALGRPSAVVCGVLNAAVLARAIIRQAEKVVLCTACDRNARLPVFARRNAHSAHDRRRRVLEQQIVVRDGGRCGRVEVAQVKTGQRTACRAADLARMQHDIHACHVLFAQRAHHLVADLVEQRRAFLVRRGERSHGFALLNKLRRRTVYRAVQIGKILRLDQLSGDIGGAVDDLLVQDLLRIAVQA